MTTLPIILTGGLTLDDIGLIEKQRILMLVEENKDILIKTPDQPKNSSMFHFRVGQQDQTREIETFIYIK